MSAAAEQGKVGRLDAALDMGVGKGADLAELFDRTDAPKRFRIRLEDHGQDFLWFEIEREKRRVGRIVDAGPFQAWVWTKHAINLKGARVGRRPMFTTGNLRGCTLNYPITSIKAVKSGAPS